MEYNNINEQLMDKVRGGFDIHLKRTEEALQGRLEERLETVLVQEVMVSQPHCFSCRQYPDGVTEYYYKDELVLTSTLPSFEVGDNGSVMWVEGKVV